MRWCQAGLLCILILKICQVCDWLVGIYDLMWLRVSRRSNDGPAKKNSTLWWYHNLYLSRRNGSHCPTRCKYYKYLILKSFNQTTGVYWSKIHTEVFHNLHEKNNIRLNRYFGNVFFSDLCRKGGWVVGQIWLLFHVKKIYWSEADHQMGPIRLFTW